MKLLPTLLAASLAVVAAGFASAQTTNHRVRLRGAVIAPNPQSLNALQTDLINAIEELKTALPIYDGNRVHAIHQVHEALVLVDQAIAGANATVRVKPAVKDTVGSTTAHSKYTKQQIQSSQATMRDAQSILKRAWDDLQSAAGSNPNQKAIRVGNHLKNANKELTAAIALH